MKDLKLRSGVRLSVIGLLFSFLSVGHAIARDFPPLAKRGTLESFDRPFVKISSKIFQLAPGVLIRDESDRIILPSLLPAGIKVVYKLEARTGFLHEMWILAPGETVRIRQ